MSFLKCLEMREEVIKIGMFPSLYQFSTGVSSPNAERATALGLRLKINKTHEAENIK